MARCHLVSPAGITFGDKLAAIKSVGLGFWVFFPPSLEIPFFYFLERNHKNKADGFFWPETLSPLPL